MEKELNLIHYQTSFIKRRRYWLLTLVGLLSVFFFIFWYNQGFANTLIPMILITIILGIPIVLRIRQNKIYLADFYSDSKVVRIRYYKGKKEFRMDTTIEDINIILKNTSARSGFNCELRLKIEDNKFIIEDTFDWSLSEMKHLFEYIKNFKNEALLDKDKFNLSRMEKKMKNSP